MNSIITITSEATSICSYKRINKTTCWGDMAIHRDYEIHSYNIKAGFGLLLCYVLLIINLLTDLLCFYKLGFFIPCFIPVATLAIGILFIQMQFNFCWILNKEILRCIPSR